MRTKLTRPLLITILTMFIALNYVQIIYGTDMELPNFHADNASIVLDDSDEPVRLVFSEPNEPTQILKRPPLYPIPWAISPNDHFYFNRPVKENTYDWYLGSYRYGSIFFDDLSHNGIDIAMPTGAEVLAANSGKVIWTGYGLGTMKNDYTDPYGKAILIKHDISFKEKRLYTAYAHLSKIFVEIGDKVNTLDAIGAIGQTGLATAPHLHFEIRLGIGEDLDTGNPELWIVPPIGMGVVVGNVQGTHGYPLGDQLIQLTAYSDGQEYFGRSYDNLSSTRDSYYKENFVISNLPVGKYELGTTFLNNWITAEIEVYPGQVSNFYFFGLRGFGDINTLHLDVEFNPK